MRGVEQVLFDSPGPRARRRIAVATVLAVLLLAGLAALAVRQFGAHGQLAADRWQPFGDWLNIRFLLIGLRYTALVTAVSAAISMPAGAVIALGRLSRRWYLHYPAVVYTELFRSLPTLLLMYVFLLAFPAIHVDLGVARITGIDVPTFWNLVIAICLTGTATIAEVFRAGILALSAGQTEAALALGMRYWQTMRLIVLPQVVRAVLPLLLVQLVNLLKDSTLGYAVGYTELLYSGKILAEYVHAPIQTYLVVTALYMVVNWLITRLAHYVERRQRKVAAPA